MDDAKYLHESRVAIVTTAGLRVENNADWNAGDQGFTQIPDDAEKFDLLVPTVPTLTESDGFSTRMWFPH